MIDTKNLSPREKALWGSFRLETPITASSGRFACESYAKWKEAKLADDAQRGANREFDEAHAGDYQSQAGVRMVVTDSSRGTGTFSAPAPAPKSAKSEDSNAYDAWISKASSAAFIQRVQSDTAFANYVNSVK